jgi:transposase
LELEVVLHGILVVLSEGCSWRAIDREEANWNSVYHYFRRWCAEGVWAAVLDRCSPSTMGKRLFLDSTHVKVHKSGCNPAGGQEHQALGRTKGGLNTKIHAAVDGKGHPAALLLSAGNEADVSCAPETLDGVKCVLLVGDKGFDSDGFRFWLKEHGIRPCIPPRSGRLHPQPYSNASYRKRHLVENFFEKLKRFRRIATRYDKLQETFFGFVCLAVAIITSR